MRCDKAMNLVGKAIRVGIDESPGGGGGLADVFPVDYVPNSANGLGYQQRGRGEVGQPAYGIALESGVYGACHKAAQNRPKQGDSPLPDSYDVHGAAAVYVPSVYDVHYTRAQDSPKYCPYGRGIDHVALYAHSGAPARHKYHSHNYAQKGEEAVPREHKSAQREHGGIHSDLKHSSRTLPVAD